MINQQIFRPSALKKITVQDDLDELLQVNSVRTWLTFGAVCTVLAGMLLWGFLGAITQEVSGFGVVRVAVLPRAVVSECDGQVDSVFFKSGDSVMAGTTMLTLRTPIEHTRVAVIAPFSGELTDLNVREGSFVTTGMALLEMTRLQTGRLTVPEVIFFIGNDDIGRLKAGMEVTLHDLRPGLPPDFMKATVTFISAHPASRSTLLNFVPEHLLAGLAPTTEYHEVRASLAAGIRQSAAGDRQILQSLNGLTCKAVVVISRHSPAAYLFQ